MNFSFHNSLFFLFWKAATSLGGFFLRAAPGLSNINKIKTQLSWTSKTHFISCGVISR